MIDVEAMVDCEIERWRKGLDDRGIVICDNPHISGTRRKYDAAMVRFRFEALLWSKGLAG